MGSSEVCVYCRRRPVEPAFRPFCSERCRMADLGRWLGGEYRVAGERAAGDGEPDHPDSPAEVPTRHGVPPGTESR